VFRLFTLLNTYSICSFSAINKTYGFSDECEERFQRVPIENTVFGVKATELKGSHIWSRFQDVFNWLPLTALINDKILCMHGGLSPNLESIDQLLNLPRPTDPCEAGVLIDLLW
jgi:serine/threonine-protein phosphatase PP1 catalytic subunit